MFFNLLILYLIFYHSLQERPCGECLYKSTLLKQDLQFLKSIGVLAYCVHEDGNGGDPDEAPQVKDN